MSYKNVYEIRNSILNYMKNTLSKQEGSYNFDIASSIAEELETEYKNVDELEKELFPWTCTKEPYLSYHLKCYGLERLKETKAVGIVTFKGSVTALIPKGSVVVSRVGVKYLTLDNAVVGNNGFVDVKVECEIGGSAGNCAIGDITSFGVNIQNVTNVTNKDKIAGGAEIEPIESAKARMAFKASTPSHSGNKNNYIEWVKEYGGVGKVSVFGAGEYNVKGGHVEIYITQFDGTIPPQVFLDDLLQHLNDTEKRPIGVNLLIKGFEPLKTNITFDEVQVARGRISKDEWVKNFKESAQLSYATEGFLLNNILPYVKVGTLALQIEGTLIYNEMKINGQTSNILISHNESPVIGDVVINKFVEV
ncbi:MAG: baseplate J/gp47 family protein [Cetobacterium sp.]|uniref:baseplate J/gp47 family protein n=1 Tax=Cetobacterium sp. TaxID=2071632 RepID=UPI003F2C8441